MDAIEVMKLMGDMGLMYKESELDETICYFMNMIKDERVIKVDKDGTPYAILVYSITDDCEPFLKKRTWEYKPHFPDGKTAYVEKIVSKGFDKELRTIFEQIIRTKYPQIEYGAWHKWAKWGDRKVVTKRRLLNV